MLELKLFSYAATSVALAALLSACADPSSTETSPAGTEASSSDSLQEAAYQAQQAARRPSYLTSDPGEGFLTPEVINSTTSIGGTSLSRAQIAPNGEFVTVLQGQEGNAAQQDLWAYDLTTGEGRLLVSSTDLLEGPEVLSEEEKNRRERAREYGAGIVTYSWVGDNLLLFPLGGDIYLYDLETQTSQQVTATKGFETDPKVSADGTKVAYVRENELYFKDLKTGLERQLSDGATDTIRNATASFVVQEELDRYTGYWLSSGADKVAYTQIDESPIAIENRLDFDANGVVNIAQRYPFTGTPNATVKLGIISTNGGETLWLDLGDDEDIYLSRVVWDADGESLVAGILSRDQKTHSFKRFNARTGEGEIIYTETSPTWLNMGPSPRAQSDGSLLWSAQRNDKTQLFSIASNGDVTALTPEDINVQSLLCQNGETGDLFVSGWRETPTERHVFKISPATLETVPDTEGGQTPVISEPVVTKITSRNGYYTARFNKDCSRYIGTYSDPNTPPQTRAYQADGTPLAWLNKNPLDETHPYAPYLNNHITPEFGQVEAEDGTPMNYVLYKPKDLKPGQKRASVTLVYGGPGSNRVRRQWNRRVPLAQMLAHHGFVVFQLDNRGVYNHGKAFEDHLYRRMGQIEVIDQKVGAKFLRSQPYIDPDRMGVYGWSYGGYMTLHMLGQTDDYASGVAGAPVTDWTLYDTAYTERYLGDPNLGAENYTEGAYKSSSVFTYLEGVTEPLLLIHGMADDNVIFRNSIMLMDRMQRSGNQNMRLMTYPGEKHGFRNPEKKTHRDRQILEFFLETLSTETGN